MDWLQIGNEVRQGCILSPCLLNVYADYIMRNARMDEDKMLIKLPDERDFLWGEMQGHAQ